MKKICYFLLCLFLFAGCDNLVLRKDNSERVTFEKRLPEGDYTLYMYEINYPSNQEDKIIFMSKFENFLKNKVEGIENDINFILPKELYTDVQNVLNDNGIGIETSFFKSASFIDENDKRVINREVGFVKAPSNGGELQGFLNKQYYYILSLMNRESEYKSDFFYTEYDKRIIVMEYLKERESLKNILNEKKKDFLVAVENIDDLENYKNDMVYLKNSADKENQILDSDFNISSPVLVIDSNNYTGYTVKNNSVVFFNGENGEELSYFRRYNFNVKIKEIDNFNYSNFVLDDEQVEISVLLGRKKYVPKRPL